MGQQDGRAGSADDGGGAEGQDQLSGPKKLDASLGGHDFNPALLAALPQGVDPCGENGEFHTLAYDGPMFLRPLAMYVGETVERDGFIFTDLLPADSAA